MHSYTAIGVLNLIRNSIAYHPKSLSYRRVQWATYETPTSRAILNPIVEAKLCCMQTNKNM